MKCVFFYDAYAHQRTRVRKHYCYPTLVGGVYHMPVNVGGKYSFGVMLLAFGNVLRC